MARISTRSKSTKTTIAGAGVAKTLAQPYSLAFHEGIHRYVGVAQRRQCQDTTSLGVEAAHDVPLQAGIDLRRHKPQLWAGAVALIPQSATNCAH